MNTEAKIVSRPDETAIINSAILPEEVKEATKKVVDNYTMPEVDLVGKVKEQRSAIPNREFRGMSYVNARGKKVMRRAVSNSGGTCSRTFAQNYERDMLSRNKKAKLPGKQRRALEDF